MLRETTQFLQIQLKKPRFRRRPDKAAPAQERTRQEERPLPFPEMPASVLYPDDYPA
jgi:hypothetical protein